MAYCGLCSSLVKVNLVFHQSQIDKCMHRVLIFISTASSHIFDGVPLLLKFVTLLSSKKPHFNMIIYWHLLTRFILFYLRYERLQSTQFMK